MSNKQPIKIVSRTQRAVQKDVQRVRHKSIPTRDTPLSLSPTLRKQVTPNSACQPHLSFRFQHHSEASTRCRTHLCTYHASSLTASLPTHLHTHIALPTNISHYITAITHATRHHTQHHFHDCSNDHHRTRRDSGYELIQSSPTSRPARHPHSFLQS